MTFIPPTLNQVKLIAAKSGLPEYEAEKFWQYFCSNGWMVGKHKMVSWSHALCGWKLRWQERETRIARRNAEVSPSVKTIQSQKELERVEKLMLLIKERNRCDSHNDFPWNPEDIARYKSLKARREELLKQLNFAA